MGAEGWRRGKGCGCTLRRRDPLLGPRMGVWEIQYFGKICALLPGLGSLTGVWWNGDGWGAAVPCFFQSKNWGASDETGGAKKAGKGGSLWET